MTEPFRYPDAPLVRCHGPRGYADTDGFRPWLRDEFTFRCAYCLQREAWGPMRAAFDLDHFLPVAKYPTAALDYDNLLYACASCNSAKQDRDIPDPSLHLHGRSLRVRSDGVIEALTTDASTIVWQLGLNLPRLVTYRSMWIEVLRLASARRAESRIEDCFAESHAHTRWLIRPQAARSALVLFSGSRSGQRGQPRSS